MSELPSYQFPARTSSGVLFGLSVARLVAVGGVGVTFIATMTRPTPASMLTGVLVAGLLIASATVRVAGRPAIDWLPVWVGYGWAAATRNNEFYASPDLTADLPDAVIDLPGELFGIELHSLHVSSEAQVANPTPAGYGVVVDTFRDRLVAVAEVSAADFLFCEPDDQQARVAAWGGVLDYVAQSLPEVCRLQAVHAVGPASAQALSIHHRQAGGRGNDATATSYRQVLDTAQRWGQDHRMLVAIALDRRAARRAIRQAGGGLDGAAQVLMDRAATIEWQLVDAGVGVHGWLPARRVAAVMRAGFDPAVHPQLAATPADVNDGGGIAPDAAGPMGLVDGWAALRHDSGWSTTLQVVRPPARPVTADFLQHLLIGVDASRRMSLLYVPTPMSQAERRAQTQQVTSESEQALRARWGFGSSARHRRSQQDAARREEDLVSGRAVYRLVWTITVTATDPAGLETSVGQVEAAARRCGLELRRLAGTQRQAACFTLPLCRGAR